MDWLDDLNKWVKENPIDLTECDNYEPWGGYNYFAGMAHTDEWKEKMSSMMAGEGNPFYGKTHSQETKQKMSQSAKNRSGSWKVKQQNRDTIYHYIAPSGECIVVKGSLNKFCKENGLNTGAMSQVHLGKKLKYKGYTKCN